MNTGIIKLNLLISYPVKWTVHAVMCDFVQNFYDAIGYKDFKQEFSYEYENEELKMFSHESFDVDWLLYMGASTKRNQNSITAGRFGEGFKIASLVAYRDYKYTISMESKDWLIRVTETNEVIEGITVPCLAYEKKNRENDGYSILKLNNVSEKDYKTFVSTINDFFYVGNPKIGKLIGGHDGYEIYKCPNDFDKTGRIYAGNQFRGSLMGYPIVVVNQHYKPDKDDRDRMNLTMREIKDCLIEVIMRLGSYEAYIVLLLLKDHWLKRPKESLDSKEIIEILVEKLSWSKFYCQEFVKTYGDCIVAEVDNHTKLSRCAMRWFSMWEGKKQYKLVKNDFNEIGIINIVELCEKQGGFVIDRESTKTERCYIDILERIAVAFFNDIIVYETLPETKIIVNKSAMMHGMAELENVNLKRENAAGLKVLYRISNVYILSELLEKGMFALAVSTYLHELLHQFGKDIDRNFHNALLMMNKRLIECSALLTPFEEEWISVERKVLEK